MRQGDGADLLGPNDPRRATIGIIYVAPHDERLGVLTAISTQARLGRKQVVLVLPEEDNKAFQTPVDFDGLKNVRRDLKIEIVVIAPSRSGPAELARLRRFPVFSSLESYARSLQDHPQAPQATPAKKRKGWAFWRKEEPVPAASALSSTNIPRRASSQPFPAQPVASAAPSPAVPADDEVDSSDDEEELPHWPQEATAPLAAGAVGMAAGYEMRNMQGEQSGQSEQSGQGEHHIQEGQGSVNGDNGGAVPPAPIDEDDWDLLPPPPPPPAPQLVDSTPPDDVSGQPEAEAKPVNPNDTPNGTPANGGATPGIIPLRRGDSGKLPEPPVSPPPPPPPPPPIDDLDEDSIPAPAPTPSSAPSPMRQRTTGKFPTPTGGRAGAGGNLPPPTARPARGGGSGSPRSRGRRRGLLIAVVVLVVLLLLCGGIAYAVPGMLGSLAKSLPGTPPSATVTITPASKDLTNTYLLTGVTGTPDRSQRQVQARVLNPATSTHSKTVPATGVQNIPAVQATGTLTFYNGKNVDQQVNAGTTFNVAGGVQIVTNAAVDIPAAAPGSFGVNSISAHAVPAGASGNIAAGTINGFCCSTDGTISVKNLSAFTGGRDAQHYTIVSESDINGAANTLETSLTPDAKADLQKQIRSGEQLVAPAQCSNKVSSDHNAGDRASNVTVTVTVTCTGEVYDQKGAQGLAADLLTQKATTSLGAGYQLVGALLTEVTQATVVDAQKGTVTLQVKAEGVWVYQFNDTQKKALAELIKGKSKKDATNLLLQQTGVAQVSIDLSSGDTLPTDVSQITITVVPVAGLKGTSTPTVSTGTGTPGVTGTQPGK